jgi:hypothetical protein
MLSPTCAPGHITADAVIGKTARMIHNRYVESCLLAVRGYRINKSFHAILG